MRRPDLNTKRRLAETVTLGRDQKIGVALNYHAAALSRQLVQIVAEGDRVRTRAAVPSNTAADRASHDADLFVPGFVIDVECIATEAECFVD